VLYNKKVEILDNLTHLTFGNEFNQKVVLAFVISYLKVENDKSHNLDYLPEGIEELVLGVYFINKTGIY